MGEFAGKYVDSFIVPVPKDRIDEYRELSALSAKIWRSHGALVYLECIAEDVPHGELTSFPRAVDLKDDETLIVAWIVYPSRQERDRINEAAMSDSRMAHLNPQSMPFDGKRLIWGGFDVFMEG